MEYQSVMKRDDLIDGDMGEMGDCSVVELLVEQTEAPHPARLLRAFAVIRVFLQAVSGPCGEILVEHGRTSSERVVWKYSAVSRSLLVWLSQRRLFHCMGTSCTAPLQVMDDKCPPDQRCKFTGSSLHGKLKVACSFCEHHSRSVTWLWPAASLQLLNARKCSPAKHGSTKLPFQRTVALCQGSRSFIFHSVAKHPDFSALIVL